MKSCLAFCIAAAVMVGLISCAQPQGGSLQEAYGCLINALGDDHLSLGRRMIARAMLAEGGLPALPLLIQHLDDKRAYNPEALADGAPADGSVTHVETVGMVCEVVLYKIVLRGRGQHGFQVDDWRAWWAENKDRDLEEIWDLVDEQNRKEPPSRPGDRR